MATNTVRTNTYGALIASYQDGSSSSVSPLSYFKYGEAGWVFSGATKVPEVPSPALTNIKSSGTTPEFLIQKSFAPGDISVVNGVITITCKLLTTEGNNDGAGANPEFFELGIFDANGMMVYYTTFDGEVKGPANSLQHVITVTN